MPLYEYQCGACGRRFELIQKFSDPPVERCPTCDGAVQKLVSSAAIQFRGAGWYVTDYAPKGQPPAEEAPKSGDADVKKPAEGADAASSSGGTDAKSSPATTPATSGSTSESSGSASKQS